MQNIQIVEFRAEHADAFRAINLAWMEQYWQSTPEILAELDDPQGSIVDTGGAINIALDGKLVIGSCALIKLSEQKFELAKMCISDSHQGLGLGRRLAVGTIESARALGAKQLYLKTATALLAAIALYESLGFKQLSNCGNTQSRCDIEMQLDL